MRCFDPLSQRSTAPLHDLVLLPASEFLLGRASVERARSMGRLHPEIRDSGFAGQEAWLKHFYDCLDTLFHYLSPNGFLLRLNPEAIEAELKRFREKFLRDAERYRRDSEEREQPFPKIEGLLLEPRDLHDRMAATRRIDLPEIRIDHREKDVEATPVAGVSPVEDSLDLHLEGKGRVSLAPLLAERIEEWLEHGSRVVLVSRTRQQAGRLEEILGNYGIEPEGVVNG